MDWFNYLQMLPPIQRGRRRKGVLREEERAREFTRTVLHAHTFRGRSSSLDKGWQASIEYCIRLHGWSVCPLMWSPMCTCRAQWLHKSSAHRWIGGKRLEPGPISASAISQRGVLCRQRPSNLLLGNLDGRGKERKWKRSSRPGSLVSDRNPFLPLPILPHTSSTGGGRFVGSLALEGLLAVAELLLRELHAA